jgi:hypothetical protein
VSEEVVDLMVVEEIVETTLEAVLQAKSVTQMDNVFANPTVTEKSVDLMVVEELVELMVETVLQDKSVTPLDNVLLQAQLPQSPSLSTQLMVEPLVTPLQSLSPLQVEQQLPMDLEKLPFNIPKVIPLLSPVLDTKPSLFNSVVFLEPLTSFSHLLWPLVRLSLLLFGITHMELISICT